MLAHSHLNARYSAFNIGRRDRILLVAAYYNGVIWKEFFTKPEDPFWSSFLLK